MAGIACAGNWILDQVKTIDCWPARGELANIKAATIGAGGAPFNVLIDLARLRVPFPTLGFGCLGRDARAAEIARICRREGVDASRLRRVAGRETSYTDVMSVESTGERTFFHCRGANAIFSEQHVDIPLMKRKGIRIFHLGYLLLLDTLDSTDRKYGTRAAKLLSDVQAAGIETSVDVVSESSERFTAVVTPALRFTDHLIINEIEAGKITGRAIRRRRTLNRAAIKQAAATLFREGVRRTVVIHAPEGLFWRDAAGNEFFAPSLNIPRSHFVGAVGAGDALAAGVLLGLHEWWDPRETARIATGVAACCIGAVDTTSGVRPLSAVRKICSLWG
jgi:sugar/nucleoside kinase (ribokinase family)